MRFHRRMRRHRLRRQQGTFINRPHFVGGKWLISQGRSEPSRTLINHPFFKRPGRGELREREQPRVLRTIHCKPRGPQNRVHAASFSYPKLCGNGQICILLREGWALLRRVDTRLQGSVGVATVVSPTGELTRDSSEDWEKFWRPLEATLIKRMECQGVLTQM